MAALGGTGGGMGLGADCAQSAAAARAGVGVVREGGKKLTFEDLRGHFGLGLKEAAANLGVCPTTLKRTCRRMGIAKWPRRHLQKLSRALGSIPPQQGAAWVRWGWLVG